MAYEKSNLMKSALAGFLVASLIIGGMMSAGILPTVEAKGLLVINVKDAPAKLEELWLNISAVQVHRKGGGNETWKNITIVTERFDLLQLENISTVLAVAELTVGNYTEIRFHIVYAEANITGETQLKPLNITAPWVMVKQSFFTIENDKVTTVEIHVEVNEEPILRAGILLPVATVTSIDYK